MEQLPLTNRLRAEGSDLCIEAADEIERLLELITAWADAKDDLWENPTDHMKDIPYDAACAALRKEVGR